MFEIIFIVGYNFSILDECNLIHFPHCGYEGPPLQAKTEVRVRDPKQVVLCCLLNLPPVN